MNKNLKLILTLSFVFFLLILSSGSVLADDDSSSSSKFREFKENKKENKKELKEEVKEERRQQKEQKKEQLKENKFEFKSFFNFLKNNNINIINGNVTAKSDTGLTINKDGKDYIVNITSGTKIVRRFFGKIAISEISIGHKVNVVGKFVNDEKTVIDAKLIRDLSITKRHGVFIGNVVSKSSLDFVIQPAKKVNQTVFFNSNTKFVNREEKPISYSDVKIGDRVRVKGIWDQAENKLSEISHVKDFSLFFR